MKKRSLLPTKTACAAGIVLLMAATAADAAVVTWSGATRISGDSDVSTRGTLEYAYTLSASDVTVNSVVFNTAEGNVSLSNIADFGGDGNVLTPFTRNSNGNSGISGFSPFDGLSADYRSAISGFAFRSRDATDSFNVNPATITLANLTSGQDYEVQLWFHDSRNLAVTRSSTVGGVTLDYNGNTANAGDNNDENGGVGQFLTGSFTADAVTQAFDIDGSPSQLNAIQVRAVPEPSSFALLGGALASFAFKRRRRRRRA